MCCIIALITNCRSVFCWKWLTCVFGGKLMKSYRNVSKARNLTCSWPAHALPLQIILPMNLGVVPPSTCVCEMLKLLGRHLELEHTKTRWYKHWIHHQFHEPCPPISHQCASRTHKVRNWHCWHTWRNTHINSKMLIVLHQQGQMYSTSLYMIFEGGRDCVHTFCCLTKIGTFHTLWRKRRCRDMASCLPMACLLACWCCLLRSRAWPFDVNCGNINHVGGLFIWCFAKGKTAPNPQLRFDQIKCTDASDLDQSNHVLAVHTCLWYVFAVHTWTEWVLCMCQVFQ